MNELKQYILIYKNYELGTVAELSSEWPRPSGTVELNYGLKDLNGELSTIFDYFIFSIKSCDLLENNPYEEYVQFVDENESEFLDIINSKEWYLRDTFGKEHRIVIPIVAENNEIVWTAFKD